MNCVLEKEMMSKEAFLSCQYKSSLWLAYLEGLEPHAAKVLLLTKAQKSEPQSIYKVGSVIAIARKHKDKQ